MQKILQGSKISRIFIFHLKFKTKFKKKLTFVVGTKNTPVW